MLFKFLREMRLAGWFILTITFTAKAIIIFRFFEKYDEFNAIYLFNHVGILLFQDLVSILFLITVMIIPTIILYKQIQINTNKWIINIQGGLIFFISFFSFLGTQYYYKYDIPFEWEHARIIKGIAQMLSSVAAELDFMSLVYFCASIGFTYAWIAINNKNSKEPREGRSNAARLNKGEFKKTWPAITAITGLVFVTSTMALLSQNLFHNYILKREVIFQDNPKFFRFLETEIYHNQIYRLTFYSRPTITSEQLNKTNDSETKDYFLATKYRFHTISPNNTIPGKKIRFPGKHKKYNIVVFLIEGVSLDYVNLKVDGKSVAPNIAALKSKSLYLNKYYANHPLSVNALFTLNTSIHSLPTDRWAATDYPDLPVKTIADMLKAQGYRTAYIHTGNLNYLNKISFLRQQGFDQVVDTRILKKHPYTKMLNWGIDDRALLKPAIEFMRSKKQPFFAMISPVTPHHPYDVPEKRFQLQDPNKKKSYREKSFAKYLNALHYADFIFKSFMDMMKEEGLMKDTIFFILGDHGEAFGQHKGNYNHPFFIYEENLRSPFYIYAPQIWSKSVEYPYIASHIDLLPTIADITGMKLEKYHQGVSLFAKKQDDIQFFHAYWKDDLDGLLDGNWKYIYNYTRQRDELYNLSTDRKEKLNLIHSQPQLRSAYRNMILAHRNFKKNLYKEITGKEIIHGLNHVIAQEKQFVADQLNKKKITDK